MRPCSGARPFANTRARVRSGNSSGRVLATTAGQPVALWAAMKPSTEASQPLGSQPATSG